MKKVLSVFLAVLMLFSVMAVGASATDEVGTWSYEGYPAKSNQAILVFKVNGGSFRDAQYVYNTTTGQIELRELSSAETAANKFVRVPTDDQEFTKGTSFTLPAVTAPKGYQFDGWQCSEGGTFSASPGGFTFPANGAYEGKVIYFTANYSGTAPEADTFSKVFDILIKVFGTIYGLLTGGDTEKGIATMKKLFGGLMD